LKENPERARKTPDKDRFKVVVSKKRKRMNKV
jgi:hypothetical protein